MNKQTKIIALAGKGGVGKTTLSSAFVRILCEKYPGQRILAIDADPAVGLATALGVEVVETLDDIRKSVIEYAENGQVQDAIEMVGEMRYRILDAVVEEEKFAFLAIGRPEGSGCYCKLNAYLKEVIALLSKDYDYIVIDGEAGIEQINRRVMERVTHLVLVSDASKKGISIISSIREVADQLVLYEKCGAIINRIEDMELVSFFTTPDTPLLALIPSDHVHARNDVMGRTIFELPGEAIVLEKAREALNAMNL